ncbi:MAG: DUF1648 domain-containing protein [Planctomycetota bacterium]|nr:MAG: DUF1648 domain-containing protein [Planctomycetota bacterium]
MSVKILMKLNKIHIIALCITLSMPLMGLGFYPFLPDQMGVHWSGTNPEPDNIAGKFWGVFLVPMLVILILPVIALPGIALSTIDIRAKIFFERFMILLVMLFFYIYLLLLLWTVGINFTLGKFATPGVVIFVLATFTNLLLAYQKRGKKSL